MRRQKGSEVHLPDMAKSSPTEVEEAENLPKADLDEMSSEWWSLWMHLLTG